MDTEKKTKRIPVMVEPSFFDRLKRRALESGVSISEAARRWLAHWAETGELPRPKKAK